MCDAAAADGPANGFFVQVGGGRVDQAVTSLKGICDDALALRCFGNLVDPETENGHETLLLRMTVLMVENLLRGFEQERGHGADQYGTSPRCMTLQRGQVFSESGERLTSGFA